MGVFTVLLCYSGNIPLWRHFLGFTVLWRFDDIVEMLKNDDSDETVTYVTQNWLIGTAIYDPDSTSG